MTIEDVERQLREVYAATASIDFGPAGEAPAAHPVVARRSLARWMPAAAAAVLVAVLAISTTLLVGRHSGSGGGARSAPPGGLSTPATSAPARPQAFPASGNLLIGVPYTYRLFIHCGAPIIGADGKAWRPGPPVAAYPGARPVDGVTTETGYVSGTLTLLSANSLRFTADPATVLRPYSVLYSPTSEKRTLPVCA